ncbi:MAG: SH3 domain-containing protein [Treponema sp.]|nr:SH3 domain-containing protein [Treponema sp.]
MNKTTRLAAVFAFCALAFCGCSEKKADAAQVDEMLALLAEESAQQVAEEVQYEKVDSVMILTGWTLYRENSEGKMIASAETRAGDSVFVYCKDEDGKGPVEKEAVRRLQNGKEDPLTFVRVSVDDEDYWTRPIFVAVRSKPCVAIDEGRLFSAPDIATMTKAVVEEGSVLAQSSADSEKDFACVFLYDGTTPYGKRWFALKSHVDSNPNVVEKYATLTRIEELGDKIKPEVSDELRHLVLEEFSNKYGKDDFPDLKKKHGTILRNGGSLKKQTNLGMEWAAEIPVGTELEILSEEPVKADWVWKGGSSKDRTFYKVRYQGKEYFVLTNECALGGQCAVIINDTVLYDKDRFSTFRNEVLEQGSLVVLTGRMSDRLNTYLREVMFYDSNASVIRTRWMWGANESMMNDDVKAAQLVALAKAAKDDDMKREYLSLAYGLNPYEPIREYIEEVERLLFPPPMTIVKLPEIGYPGLDCEEGDNVNVRDAPKTGEVVGKLGSGADVSVDMKTEEQDTIDGETSYWYHVNATVDGKEISGWVFGAFLLFGGE